MNMNDSLRIFCENTGRSLFVNRGTSLLQIAEILSLGEREDRPFLAAYVNNRLKELDFAVYSPVSIRYVDITHFEGMRVYQRTLFFVLQKAVYDLFPERKLHIKHSVAKGLYCERVWRTSPTSRSSGSRSACARSSLRTCRSCGRRSPRPKPRRCTRRWGSTTRSRCCGPGRTCM